MKFVSLALLSTTLLSSLSGAAWAFSEEWYACQSSSDCVKAAASCTCGPTKLGVRAYDKRQIGVNKQYAADYSKSADALCGTADSPFTIFSKKGLERHCDDGGHPLMIGPPKLNVSKTNA